MKERVALPVKTYKIHKIYKLIFDSFSEVYGKRDFILNVLLKKIYGKEIVDQLPNLTKGALLEKIIDSLLEDNSILTNQEIIESDRIKEFRAMMDEKINTENLLRDNVAFRTLPIYFAHIKELAKKTKLNYGVILEIAIANLLYNANDLEYELVKMSFNEFLEMEAQREKEENENAAEYKNIESNQTSF